jgi:hypothetical protein
MIINTIHRHISNGGITVSVNQSDDEFKNISIEMTTQYLGHPSVTSILNFWGLENGTKFMSNIGSMLIQAAEKIDAQKGEVK